eukprot:93386-Amphidinium_carterae.1
MALGCDDMDVVLPSCEEVAASFGFCTKGLTSRHSWCPLVPVLKVSSSDALLDHAYGSEIDDAELVIRLNDAPLGGEHAEHVGEHEHIRLVNGGFGAKVLAGDMEINNDAVYVLMRPLQHQVEEAKRVLEAHPNARIVLGNEQLALA